MENHLEISGNIDRSRKLDDETPLKVMATMMIGSPQHHDESLGRSSNGGIARIGWCGEQIYEIEEKGEKERKRLVGGANSNYPFTN